MDGTAASERRIEISAKLFVGNLSFKTTEDELTELLAEAGDVVDVHLPSDRVTGRPRGFAFVEFANEEQVEKAIELFDGKEFGSRELRLRPAEDSPRPSFRPPPPRGPAGKGGRGSKPKGSRRGLRGKKRSL